MSVYKNSFTFSFGKYTWNFYKNRQGDLVARQYDQMNHTLLEEITLVPDFKTEYSLVLDLEDTMHLVAVDSNPKINYLFWDGKQWSEITNLEPLHPGHLNNLMLTSAYGQIHLVYLLQNENTNVRVHQYCTNNRWSEPQILHTVGTPYGKAVIQLNTTGQLHLVGPEANKEKQALKHYIYYSTKNKWQHYLNISTSRVYSEFKPSLIIDRKNKLHLVWLSSDGINMRVRYRRYQVNNSWSGWTKEQTLSSPYTNAYSPILMISGNNLLVLWQQIDGIYISTSQNQGKSWSIPQKTGPLQDFLNFNVHGSVFSLDLASSLNTTMLLDSPQLFQDITSIKKPTIPNLENTKQGETQLTPLDQCFHSPTFTIEDNQLTYQQIASSINNLQEGIKNNDSKLYHFYVRLQKLVVENSSKISKIQQKIEQMELENNQKIIQKNDVLKNIEQQLKELKKALVAIKKNLKHVQKLESSWTLPKHNSQQRFYKHQNKMPEYEDRKSIKVSSTSWKHSH